MSEQQEKALLALYRRSRTEQPSVLIDRRIRKAALDVQQQKRRRRNRRLWAFSSVAVLLLSVNIVLQLFDQTTPEVMVPMVESDSVAQVDSDAADQQLATPELARILPQAESLAVPQEALSSEKERKIRKRLKKTIVSSAALATEKPRAPDVRQLLAQLARDARQLSLFSPTAIQALQQQEEMDNMLKLKFNRPGQIELYSSGQLILRRQTLPRGYSYQVWRGVENLGLNIDWSLTPPKLKSCDNVLPDQSLCPLTPHLTAVFSGQRLESVSWQATDE